MTRGNHDQEEEEEEDSDKDDIDHKGEKMKPTQSNVNKHTAHQFVTRGLCGRGMEPQLKN